MPKRIQTYVRNQYFEVDALIDVYRQSKTDAIASVFSVLFKV